MAVFAGMIGVTLFGLFLTPVFYVVLRRFVARRRERQATAGAAADGSPVLPGAIPLEVGHG